MTDPQYTILDSISDGALIINREFEIVFANHSFLVSRELLSNNIIGENCYTSPLRNSLQCLAQSLLEPVFQKSSPVTQNHEYLLKDGSKRILQILVSPLKNENGEVFRLLQIIKDITKQKKLQLEADQHLQHIIQSDKLSSLGEVVAGVAHEINNPNSFITYNIPLLEEIWQILQPLVAIEEDSARKSEATGIPISELCQDMSEIIEAIKVGSSRINQVVSNLKDFARMDESALTKSVQINEIINKSYSIVGAQLRKSTGNIVFHLEEDLPTITGHFQKLEQVIANLLTNAGHALQGQSGGSISISTRFIERLDGVAVSIEDNGTGMEPEILSRLFEPFVTTRRDSGGTGLGLSVSYGLIREHGGCIGVLSKPGIGTRFTIFLPKSPDRELQDLHPAMLLMGDDENILPLKSVWQENSEESIFHLREETTVCSFLENHPEVDIVFTPTHVARINDWQLLKEVKKHFPLVSVVLVSPKDTEQPETPDNVKPDYQLSQPVTAEQLTKVINSLSRMRL